MKELKMDCEVSSFIDFSKYEGKDITLTGSIQNLRVLGWGGFIILRSNSYMVQCVAAKESVNIENLSVESVIKIVGLLKTATIKDKSIIPNNYEIELKSIEVLSTPSIDVLPVDTTKRELNVALDTKFDLRPLTLRHPKQRAIFKIQSTIFNAFGNYLTNIGFNRICSPKIVFSGAEGGANIFQLDYFKRKAFLTQSPQFYKQMMVGVFGRVFEESPVFRAEKHDTSRHLNEYISLDLEMMLSNGFEDLIVTEANVLAYIFDNIRETCKYEIELLEINVPIINKIVTMKFNEVHETVFQNYKKDFRGEKDLAPEEEQLICDYVKKTYDTEFVFVTHYPMEKRPFYTMEDKNDLGYSLSFDLLFRGLEITTGGQRLNKYEDYIDRMGKLNMNIDSFDSFLQTFKYGMPPHGGLGLGLERLTAQICGLSNVKEASLFPRDINRLTP